MKTYLSRSLWSRILIVLGGIGMIVGAIDPMEGSVVILPGSLLFALGTYLSHCERQLIAYRVWVFMLVAIGVGAMWGFTMIGGFGGKSGHSAWGGADLALSDRMEHGYLGAWVAAMAVAVWHRSWRLVSGDIYNGG